MLRPDAAVDDADDDAFALHLGPRTSWGGRVREKQYVPVLAAAERLRIAAPFYLVVYPVGSTAATTYLCAHLPVDNCPTHGPGIAALAQSTVPSVYGAGVIGHDHLMDFPGGADFNIAWEPVIVLFTNKEAANEHVLTDTRIEELVASGDAIEVPRPTRTFICASVPATIYDRATPIVP